MIFFELCYRRRTTGKDSLTETQIKEMFADMFTSAELEAALDELILAEDRISYYDDGREIVLCRDVNELEKNDSDRWTACREKIFFPS